MVEALIVFGILVGAAAVCLGVLLWLIVRAEQLEPPVSHREPAHRAQSMAYPRPATLQGRAAKGFRKPDGDAA